MAQRAGQKHPPQEIKGTPPLSTKGLLPQISHIKIGSENRSIKHAETNKKCHLKWGDKGRRKDSSFPFDPIERKEGILRKRAK